MAMTKCKECGAQISTTAESCPHCGAKQKKKTSGCALIFLAVLLTILFVAMCAPGADRSRSSTSATAPQSAAPPQPKDPAVELAEQKQALEQIEERLKTNADRLKRYYASPDQLRQATSDIVRLALIKASYGDAPEQEKKQLGQKASRLLPQVEQQSRELYASSLSEIFIKSGMDVEVSATGREKKRLRISYALMSQPLIYKFQNEIKIQSQAAPLGFTQIVYTNGFESSMGKTWTVEL